MTRRLRNPGDLRGIPGVARHTPVPRRDHPLPGTRILLCPKTGNLREMVAGRSIEDIKPSRTATVLGILAMAGSVFLLAIPWLEPVWNLWPWVDEFGTGVVILTLGFVHVAAVLTQALSNGRNLIGGLAILVLYAGSILGLILRAWL